MTHADLHYVPNDLGGAQVLRRCLMALASAGLMVHPSYAAPALNSDRLLICHHVFATPAFLDKTTRPVVILERFDASGPRGREQAKHPAVKLIIKGSVSATIATDPRRPHYEILSPGSQEIPNEPLSAHDAAKYVSALTLGQYDRMTWLNEHEPDLDADRPIDVFFAGLLRDDDPILGAHRAACIEAIKALPAGVNRMVVEGRPMKREAYFRACRKAKIMVSPWGYGEACYRDWEAWASGAILIKPRTREVDCWPGVYKPATRVTCNHDWSDLKEKVSDVLVFWYGLNGDRAAYRRMFAESYQPQTIASHFVCLLKDRGLA